MFILRKKSTRSCLMLYFKFLDLLLSSQNTDSSTVTSGSLSLLTFNTESPPMTDTSVKTDFLHAIVIFTKFVIQVIGDDLGIFTVFEITLSVQKPNWDFEVLWLHHGGLNAFQFFFIQLSSAFRTINFSVFQNQIGKSASHTTDVGESVGDFDVTINICVLHTKNMLEIFSVDEGHVC